MPIYEYRCTSCGHELEALQKITDQPLTACPACKQDALQKKVSAAGFQLKGSGWYVTDFRNRGAKQAAKGDAAKSTAEGNGSGGDKSPGTSETTTEATSTKSGAATETKSTTTVSSDKSGT